MKLNWARNAALAFLAMQWLGLTFFILFSRGQQGELLQRAFGRANRPDAFHGFAEASYWFWVVHTAWTLLAVAAIRCRQRDVLITLAIGPLFGLAFGGGPQDWTDPNWFAALAVCTIAWFVGTIVAGAVWRARDCPEMLQ